MTANQVTQSRTLSRKISLTEVGFGGAQLGNLFQKVSDVEAELAVRAAWSAGIRYFDTAPHYGLGLSERRLGSALSAYHRADYVVSTKVGRLLVPSPETAELEDEGFAVPADHRRVFDFSRDGIFRSIEASLQRLGLDHIDIAYLHDPDEHWGEASTTGIDALIQLREQGLVGAIGAGMNQSKMLAEFVRRCDVDVVMIAGRLTLLDTSALQDLIPAAHDRGVGVVAAGVFNSGLLGNRRVSEKSMFDYRPAPRALVTRANLIADMCEAHGVTLPEVAVAFPLQLSEVVSVVLGMRTPDQVVENVGRFNRVIPAGLWRDLKSSGLVRT